MRFLGSKSRISKYLVPILQQCIDDNNVTIYCEPFVGGANVIDKIRCEIRIGNDIHEPLIAMWKALQSGWRPPSHISEEEYNSVRDRPQDYPDYYVGYVGYHATFGAKYFGGYARSPKLKRDESNEAYRNTMKQIPFLQDVQFCCGEYLNIDLSGAVIYCDPPYYNTSKYEVPPFNYNKFWQWCRDMSKNNFVFISEYNAPDDFDCIWSRVNLTSLDCNRGFDTEKKQREEKLFVYRQ